MTDRSDFKPLQIIGPTIAELDTSSDVILAVSCVADAMTIRRSVVIRDRRDGTFMVQERIEAPEEGAGSFMAGSYDLTLSEALTEAARRIKREEGYVSANAAAA
jgi:hypothetical protein